MKKFFQLCLEFRPAIGQGGDARYQGPANSLSLVPTETQGRDPDTHVLGNTGISRKHRGANRNSICAKSGGNDLSCFETRLERATPGLSDNRLKN